MTEQELTFKEGYDVLKKNVDLLESQEEPDIDNLMKIGFVAQRFEMQSAPN